MTLDLNSIQLPDLTDATKFPTVSHAPSCTDSGPVDTRTCHPLTLVRVRPYELPTEPLGRLKFTWNRLRELIPVPPRLGIHCPTIATETNVAVGDAGAVTHSVETQGGDACLPKLVSSIVFPCTRLNPQVTVTGGIATGSWDAPVNHRDANQCIQDVMLRLNIPCPTITMVANPGTGGTLTITPSGDSCNPTFTFDLEVDGGGSSTSGGGFIVGTPGDHAPPFGTDPCTTGYQPGDETPVVDAAGVLGTAGDSIDPTTNEVLNGTKQVLVKGDVVSIIKLAIQPPLPARTQWLIVNA